MLQLQRASAGSGKTYTLTKIYIRNFIAKKIGNHYRLRTEVEMRAVHGRILAITFTNKATNEMKQRIVTALANLAGLSDLEDEKIDYLSDFIEEFSASKEEVQYAALRGLNILLHGYSDFQISTIDSFFQSILRTLAVETDRNESYQIELDDKYLSQVGVDMTLSEVNDNSKNKKSEAKFWIQSLILDMLRNGEGWNPFTKNKSGLYGELISFTNLFHSEVFKENVEAELMEYLTSGKDFMKVYRQLKESQKACYEQYKKEYLKSRANILIKLEQQGCDFNSLNKNYGRLWQREKESDFADVPIGKVKFELKNSIMSLQDAEEDDRKILVGANKEKAPALQGLASMFCDHRELMLDWEISDRYWSAMNSKLYYLGLIKSIKENIRQFREENNIIPLSETNRILQGIINEDDAPFIYERVGTYLNYYLIDEFQDTSRLQWGNLCPLLSESLSHEDDYDNLIIGDVKQSIYRFRNAEPMLIQEDVPNRFDCEIRGESVDENTNWRSSREVVKFNNSFFHNLAMTLDDENSAENSDNKRLKISSLYSNAIQKIKNIDKPGYVEVNFLDDKGNAYGEMGNLVHRLLDKGYNQRDIAFLVSNADHGVKLIDALMEYNAAEENADKIPISVISEQSLKISGSSAVKLVVAVLEFIVRGNAKKTCEKSKTSYSEVEMDEFISSYNYIHCKNRDLSPTEIIERYFNDDSHIDSVSKMLKDVYTVALPALVENVIQSFVPEELKKSDVAFLSAFQDKVLEYCQIYPSDIASFLRWWKDTGGDNSSISSPEDTDAVQIMTIHKSKGLEFKCVIIPLADWCLGVSKSSTIWVRPKLPKIVKIDDLPPYLPIKMDNNLKDTLYAADYERELDRIIVDELNKTYVAFTRAVDELYIYAPSTKEAKSMRIGDLLKRIIPYMHNSLLDDNKKEYTVKESDIIIDDTGELMVYKMGEVTVEDVKKSKEKSDKPKSGETEIIDKYYVNTRTKLLMTDSQEDVERESEDAADDIVQKATIERESKENRRRGRLMHSIMEQVIVADDLPAAIRRMKIKGKLKSNDEEIETFLKKKIADKKVARWFDKDLKVMTERTILCGNTTNRRPDRIVISKEGDVEVIDYKFGEQLNGNDNMQQVERYIRMLRNIKAEDGTSKFRSVRGYLWYVSLDVVKEIKVESSKSK